MPEAPQMQALAERVVAWLGGATFEGYEPLGFSGRFLLVAAVPASPVNGTAIPRSTPNRRASYEAAHTTPRRRETSCVST